MEIRLLQKGLVLGSLLILPLFSEATEYSASIHYTYFFNGRINASGEISEAILGKVQGGENKIFISRKQGANLASTTASSRVTIDAPENMDLVYNRAFNPDGTLLLHLQNGASVGLEVPTIESSVLIEGSTISVRGGELFDFDENGNGVGVRKVAGKGYFGSYGDYPDITIIQTPLEIPIFVAEDGTVTDIPHPSGGKYGFEWTVNPVDQIPDYYTLDNRGVAVAINDKGQVLCDSVEAPGEPYNRFDGGGGSDTIWEFAFIYDITTGKTTKLPGVGGGVRDLNNLGEVVSGSVSLHFRPAMSVYLPVANYGLTAGWHSYEDNTSPQILPESWQDLMHTGGLRISDKGQIIMRDPGYGKTQEIWDQGEFKNIGDLADTPGFEIQGITDMNAKGQMLARVISTADGPNPGTTYSMILNPSSGLTVNVTNDLSDADDSDGVIDVDLVTTGRQISLRAAIDGLNAGVGDTIDFAIPGSGVPVITLTKALPVITKAGKIDGTTQAAKRVEIRGGGLDIVGLQLEAGESEVRGLVMNGFIGDNSACLRLQDGGGNTIVGNYFGTDATGSASVATSYGLSISNSAGNRIGGSEAGSQNVFGSILGIGIRGDNNEVVGNRIGVGLDDSLLPVESAIGILSGDSIKIGGAGTLQNFIAASDSEIFVAPEVPIDGLTIDGNRIGLDGTGQLAHGASGAYSAGTISVVSSPSLQVSGLRIENNKIAGGSPEIWLAGGGVSGAIISGNEIGLAFDGSGNLPTFVSENNRDYGIRLDKAPSATISGNTIVGHEFNIVVSGENQYTQLADEIQFNSPGNELDPAPAGDPSSNVLIESNSIGLVSDQKPAGVEQDVGVAVFGNAKTVTIRDNTIAGHGDDEIWLVNGESHSIVGNRIGTANGTDYGSADGIVINDANLVTIGSEGAEGRNVISRNSAIGIKVVGSAQGTRILNNYIGTNTSATGAWPNAVGILIDTAGEESPKDTEISGNVVAGNSEQGIYVRTDGKTSVQNNYIGRSVNGVEIPNEIGVEVKRGETSFLGNQIAFNLDKGVVIETTDSVKISKGGIYENGDSMSRDGIRYVGVPEPLAPPDKLVILRSNVTKDNGKRTVWIGLPSREGGGTMTLEIFGNPQSDEEEPQGKLFLLQKSIDTSKPYTAELEFDAGSEFMSTNSFTATLTAAESTSEFSRIHVVFEWTPPVVEFLPLPSGPDTVWILATPAQLYTLKEARLPYGPWTAPEKGELVNVSYTFPGYEEPLEVEVWKVTLDPDFDQQFWQADLDWEKLLGEPVDR